MALSHNPRLVTDGLVLCLDAANPKSYPGSGTTWFDLSGNGNDGTLVNGVGYSGDNNGSMVFDGSNDYVVTYNINESSHTLLCFFKANSISNIGHSIFSGNAGGDSAYSGMWLDDTGFLFYLLDDAKAGGTSFNNLTGSAIDTGSWYFAAQTYNGSTGDTIGYLNGNPDASGNRQPGVVFNDETYIIGSRTQRDSFYFDGKIPFVQVYNRALTESEIKQNFNALRGRYGI